MFRATHCPSSGAQNCTGSLWFGIHGKLVDVWLLDADSIQQPHGQQLAMYAKPEAAVSVQQPHIQQLSMYAKPEAASAVLGS